MRTPWSCRNWTSAVPGRAKPALAAQAWPDRDAWALKERCLAAWSTDPREAALAAEALRALARRAEATPQAVVHALADWCDGVVHLSRGVLGLADAALDRAALRFEAHGDTLHAAQTQVARVMALALQGHFDAALSCGLAAQRVLLAAGELRAAAKISLNLGSLSLERDAYAEAVVCYRQAAVHFARIGDSEHSVMADIGLADALAYQGHSAEAAHIYDRAAMRARLHALPVLQASALQGRALLDLATGRHTEGLAGLERSRRDFAALDAQHLQIEAESTLADAYLELRLLPEAIALYRDLAPRLRAQHAATTLAWSQARLAQALALGGDALGAQASLAEAAGLFEDQQIHTGRAVVALVQSQLHETAGNPAKALHLARRAEQLLADVGSAELLPTARLRVAESHLASGDAALAEAACAELLASPGSALVQVRALATQALAIALHRPQAARAALEQAIDAAEEVRAALPGDDLRRAYLADATRPHVRRLQLALDDAESDPTRTAEVLHWLERVKARALADRLGQAAHQSGEPRAAARGAAHDSRATAVLRAQLDHVDRRLRQHLESEEGAAPQTLRDAATRLEQALLEQARRDRLARPSGPFRTATAVAPDLAAAVLQRLGDDCALVEYGIAGDELFALVGQGGRWHLFRRLAQPAALAAAVRALRFQIDPLCAGLVLNSAHGPQRLARVQRRLQDLHALVWAPLAASVGATPRLLIVPHGPLHRVPFAALSDGRKALIDDHQLCHAASATVALAGLGRDPVAPQQAVLVGAGAHLPQVQVEIDAVAQLFPQALRLQGANASMAELCRHAGSAGLLHLSCHAEFRADSPLFSALHLDDGVLSAAQIEALPLSAALVVLSACDTALGDSGAGDEGVGLVRAFLIAGAKRVMGSQWPVDDAGTAAFMQCFHRAWRGGGSAAAALRLAQLECRARSPHPFHWAAFGLHGGG